MRSKRLTIWLLLIGCWASAASAATVLDVSVIVRCQLTDGSTAGGSGTLIDSRGGHSLILSCGHVFRGAASNVVAVTFHDGRQATGTLLRRSETPDLAVVSVAVDSPVVAPLATTEPPVNEPTHTVGLFVVRAGPIRRVWLASNIYNLIVGRQSVDGDSGGGVFNSHGELVGVHWGGARGEAFAVGVAPIRRFLESLGIAETGCRWQRDPCGGWVKICDQQPATWTPPQPQQQPPASPNTPPASQPTAASPLSVQIEQHASQLTTITQKITTLEQQCKPCECGQCCDRLREEFNARLETLAANQVQITNSIQHAATPNYDAIAAEVAKRLTHSATVTLLDGTKKTQTKPLGEPLEFIQHSKGLK